MTLLACALLAACAAEKLALAPAPGVDFSGRWKLNEADSDDPQRLIQNQVGGPGSSTPGGGRPGRSGGRGGGGPPMGGDTGGLNGGPVAPGVGVLSEGLRWPGKDLDIKQVAGVAVFTSGGLNRVYQPTGGEKRRPPVKPADEPGATRDRNMHARGRGDGAPAVCGWDGRTLVVLGGEADDERPAYEERYSVSDDGQRLIEVVGFKGGRSSGYTMSRVWDRVPSSAPPAPTPSSVR